MRAHGRALLFAALLLSVLLASCDVGAENKREARRKVGPAESQVQTEHKQLSQSELQALRLSYSPAEAAERLRKQSIGLNVAEVATAASKGNAEAVALYLATGADVNAVELSDHHMTLLHGAVVGGYTNIVEFLLAEGADIELREPKSELTPLHKAAISGNAAMMKLLIDHGADSKAVTKGGHSILHISAGENRVDCLEYAIGLGLDIESRDKETMTPLLHAARAGAVDTIPVLLQHGADVNRADLQRGFTPVIAAAYMSKYQAATVLAAGGADLNRKMLDGQTLASVMCGTGDAEAAEWLVEHGIDINQPQGKLGLSCLMIAASTGSPYLVEALLKAGADPSLKSSEGDTAADLARANSYEDLARTIEAAHQ